MLAGIGLMANLYFHDSYFEPKKYFEINVFRQIMILCNRFTQMKGIFMTQDIVILQW